MRPRFSLIAGTAVLAVAGSLLAASPALATACSTAGCTDVTFSLTGGALTISVPSTASSPVSLGTGTAGSGTITNSLGAVSVSDQRGLLNGTWTATVSATSFATGGGTPSETIPNTDVSYWSGATTAFTGIAVLTAGQATSLLAAPLSGTVTAFSATATDGNNTATWNPTLIVNVPAQAVVGTYAGVVTHSIA